MVLFLVLPGSGGRGKDCPVADSRHLPPMTSVLGLSAVTVHVHRDRPVSWVVLSALRAVTCMWCRMNSEPKTLSSITTDYHHDPISPTIDYHRNPISTTGYHHHIVYSYCQSQPILILRPIVVLQVQSSSSDHATSYRGI